MPVLVGSRRPNTLQAGLLYLTNNAGTALVGLSPSPCLRRVKRLEREGHIETYRAILQRDRVGLGLTVFVTVKIEGHATEQALALEDALIAMPEVTACHMTSGETDYLLEVTVPDREAYQAFLSILAVYDPSLMLLCLVLIVPATLLNTAYAKRTLRLSAHLHDVLEREVK